MDAIKRVFDLIKVRGMQQKTFAEKVGVAPSKVSEWKKGKSKSYTDYWPQIADALNTSVEYLLTGKTQNSPPPEGDELSENIRLKVSLLRDDVKLELDHYIDYLLARQDDP